MKNATRQLVGLPSLAIAIAIASGCGGSGDSDSDSSIVSRGMVTGFGSVYVNGVRYHTGGTSFSVDDDIGSESDLRVGMVVTVRGSRDDDGRNGTARQIIYDNELKGPVASIVYDNADPALATSATMSILGQTVLVGRNTTIDDDGGLTFEGIQVSHLLEVSGFITDSGLQATHIEKQDALSEIELKGHIDVGSLVPEVSFSVNGFPVIYTASTPLDDIDTLVEGLFVEVEGQLDGLGTTLIASEIELEHAGLDDDMDEAEIQGAIHDYDPNVDPNTFKILGQPIDVTGADFYPSTLVLDNDLVVEVEGHILNGVLYADEVEQKGKKIKIYATLSAVSDDSISFNFNGTEILARVNHQTELEDDINDTEVSLAEFIAGNFVSRGDFVEMEAFDDGSGDINAVEVELKSADEVRVVAPVQSWDEASETVTMLGVDFDLASAKYENRQDQPIDAAAFYGSLSVGMFVKIKDAANDGNFEKAELDD